MELFVGIVVSFILGVAVFHLGRQYGYRERDMEEWGERPNLPPDDTVEVV